MNWRFVPDIESRYTMNPENEPFVGQKVTLRGVDFVVTEVNRNRKTGSVTVELEELEPPKTYQRITE